MENEQNFEFQSSGKSVQFSHRDGFNKYRPAGFSSVQCLGKNISKPVEESVILVTVAWHRQHVRAPTDKIFPSALPKNKGGAAKNLYAKSERPSHSCRVTWARCEDVDWYSRQKIMILRRKTDTYATLWGGSGSWYRPSHSPGY